ncbi:MAG: tRNA glutamyl-Q(34) synthetase GluQRS [Lamprobacter sp.]|uniref:tRNA glutamyl-Q(34) synthetase GluQRS n=1 Tax=Lamprobacter sp. TaxID=3100796 RepID=UPI002B25F59F|nr:tRNA glutamyl-Q(34) synthetase GluQRS [Lamprobacter sp.]MEA3639130.1 tRNA glutamyl-Q(34) synthetase GluQRS [Lamprobacter sp.]
MDGRQATPRYRGRFAPSPTGPLHFGSLLAAVGSFADARQQQGAWLVRIEDLDQQRCLPGADVSILKTLQAFGLCWDEPPSYQSQRTAYYEAALERLQRDQLCYPCACTRREIAALGLQGLEGPIYPGCCRAGLPPGRRGRSLRLRIDCGELSILDRIHGLSTQHLSSEVGDIVLRRADGFYAYQLAVVVDDGDQGITRVVRGADLLGSTQRQVYLQRCLGLPQPEYAHLPLMLGGDGRKLSKSLAAAPVDATDPLPALTQAWHLLGQRSLDAAPSRVDEFWQQAIPRWDLARVPLGPLKIAGSDPLPAAR